MTRVLIGVHLRSLSGWSSDRNTVFLLLCCVMFSFLHHFLLRFSVIQSVISTGVTRGIRVVVFTLLLGCSGIIFYHQLLDGSHKVVEPRVSCIGYENA